MRAGRPSLLWLTGAVALVAVVLAGAAAFVARSARPKAAPGVLGEVPAFNLVDQNGERFTAGSMAGHVTVVDFFFTRCMSSCPRLTAHMADLQQQLVQRRSSARLVSFSVDPENDTPHVLWTYAANAKADPARWSFVTGAPDDVSRAVVLGFKVSAAKMARDAGDYDVIHGDWFVLVDAHARIRGYYAMEEPGAFERLMADVRTLEGEG